MPLLRPVLALLLVCLPVAARGGWVIEDASIMGTSVHVRAWHADAERARAAVDAALDALATVDRTMSPQRADSELARLNAEGAEHPVAIGAPLGTVLERAFEVSRLTGGAFDVTFASVGHLYDYREGRRPGAEEIEARLPAIDWRHVRLDRERGTASFAREGVRVDLGGIAKGFAVEWAARRMREHGVRHGQVTAGGDTRLVGDRRGRPWIVGVRHPRAEGRLVTRIPAVDEAVSTSGDYERYFEADGIRYHHIIDPDSGDSARAVRSVTVLGPDATFTDAFSTSVFVLGPRRGLAFIEGRDGYEAVIVDGAGRVRYSSGLAAADGEPPSS